MAVTRVIDGDTFVADDGSEKGVIIRLIGVDAPESRNTRRRKIGYYGQQSKEYLSRLLENQMVRLEYDVDKTDPYNRTLAYVYLADGTFVNAELVKQGYAQIMTIPPNVKYAERFLKLQRRARNNNRGLWNEDHIEK
jgi:micrococcal nuclease